MVGIGQVEYVEPWQHSIALLVEKIYDVQLLKIEQRPVMAGTSPLAQDLMALHITMSSRRGVPQQ